MKITNVNDYVESVSEKFPGVAKTDIKRILNFAFKSLYLSNAYGCDTFIKDSDLWMYIGFLTKNPIKHFQNYKNKLALKIRILNKRKKIPWDGYYYFGISDKQLATVEQLKKKTGRPRKYFEYGKVKLFKLLEECELRTSSYKYFYRIPFITYTGNSMWIENLKTDKAELIKVREPLKFVDILTTNKNYTYGG